MATTLGSTTVSSTTSLIERCVRLGTDDIPAAYAIHAEIHKARPDVLCAAHSHSVYGRAMCATGKTLDMLTQDFAVFYNDHVLYP